jgi:hypothetical protein
VTRVPPACRTHRPVLVDLVDHGERGPATASALDHLDTCRPCEREITELALTIAALRRAGAWSWRLQLGGLVTSAAIAALMVAPRVGVVPVRPAAAAPVPQHPARVVTWQAVEHRLAVTPDVAPVATVRSLPPRYPEGLTRPWKEVPPTDAAARELEPS